MAVQSGFNCELKFRWFPPKWLMQSAFENLAFHGVKAHLFNHFNNLGHR